MTDPAARDDVPGGEPADGPRYEPLPAELDEPVVGQPGADYRDSRG